MTFSFGKRTSNFSGPHSNSYSHHCTVLFSYATKLPFSSINIMNIDFLFMY